MKPFGESNKNWVEIFFHFNFKNKLIDGASVCWRKWKLTKMQPMIDSSLQMKNNNQSYAYAVSFNLI